MDKNALTEKRRETVIGLLKGMYMNVCSSFVIFMKKI